jgi:hypothetical protein
MSGPAPRAGVEAERDFSAGKNNLKFYSERIVLSYLRGCEFRSITDTNLYTQPDALQS